jgi:hypothetical protein
MAGNERRNLSYNPGDVVHEVHLSCGHTYIDINRGAAKKPSWMLYDINSGMKVDCPCGCGRMAVRDSKLIRGWRDE